LAIAIRGRSLEQAATDGRDPPPEAIGRPRADPRRILNGIIHVMRSGCQWNRLPEQYGSDSTVHGTMQRRVVERTLGWLGKCRAIPV